MFYKQKKKFYGLIKLIWTNGKEGLLWPILEEILWFLWKVFARHFLLFLFSYFLNKCSRPIKPPVLTSIHPSHHSIATRIWFSFSICFSVFSRNFIHISFVLLITIIWLPLNCGNSFFFRFSNSLDFNAWRKPIRKN